jgi:hypothetical protein
MLKLIESKATGLSVQAPDFGGPIATPSGRCLHCGHPMPNGSDGGCGSECNCGDCSCCINEETTDGRGLD